MIERVVKVTNVSQFNVVLWAIISKQFLSEQWDIGNLESELNTASLTQPHSCLRHFVRGKKSKSGLLQARKIQKTGLRPQKTGNASGLQLKKCPKKIRRIPKTIFMSLFIFRLTNFNDIYHVIPVRNSCLETS